VNTAADFPVLAFEDDWRALEPGAFPCDYSARGEYHAVRLPGATGPWYEPIVHHRWSHPRWHVLAGPPRVLAHMAATPGGSLLVAGGAEWDDARVEIEARPLAASGGFGLAFRYRDSRRHYRIEATTHGSLRVVLVHDDARVPLARCGLHWPCGTSRRLWIEARGERFAAGVDGERLLEWGDRALALGGVALWASAPCRFGQVRVTSSAAALERACERALHTREERRRESANHPRAVRVRSLATEEFGAGRHLRFADLDGDGRPEILVPQHAPLVDGHNYPMVTALTALDLDGRVLWQTGRPAGAHERDDVCADLPVQVGDLDGDGCAEVVIASDYELRVLDGRTGEVRRTAPTPRTPRVSAPRLALGRLRHYVAEAVVPRLAARLPFVSAGPAPWFPWPEDITWRTTGDALFLCGPHTNGDAGILFKNRYSHVWAFDRDLRPLWDHEHNTGHYFAAADVEGDGHDEILSGYTLLGADGRVRWSRGDLTDHADAVAIYTPDRAPGQRRIALAAGDEGLLWLDAAGKTLARSRPGHVQRLGIGRFRDDLPGPQCMAATWWGGRGIVTMFDADGVPHLRLESPGFGLLVQPVRWTKDACDLALLSADMRHGGLMDGFGRRVVELPDDGHPEWCSAALDLFGAGRDTLVCWNPGRIDLYVPEDARGIENARRAPGWAQSHASNYGVEVRDARAGAARGGA